MSGLVPFFEGAHAAAMHRLNAVRMASAASESVDALASHSAYPGKADDESDEEVLPTEESEPQLPSEQRNEPASEPKWYSRLLRSVTKHECLEDADHAAPCDSALAADPRAVTVEPSPPPQHQAETGSGVAARRREQRKRAQERGAILAESISNLPPCDGRRRRRDNANYRALAHAANEPPPSWATVQPTLSMSPGTITVPHRERAEAAAAGLPVKFVRLPGDL